MREKDLAIGFYLKLEALRVEVRNTVDFEKRETHEETSWKKMNLSVKHGLHEQYHTIMENMITLQRSKAQLGESGQIAATANNAPITDSNDDYENLDYHEVKRAVILRYQNISKTWNKTLSPKRKFASVRFNTYTASAAAREYDAQQHETLPDKVNPEGIVSHQGC